MKRKLFIAAILGVFILSGCEDFLDEQPVSSLSKDNFYNNGTDLRYAIDGAYALTRQAYANESVITELRTINSTTATNEGEWDDLDTHVATSNNTLALKFWNAQYDVINSTNLVLENIDIATEDEGRSLIEAEALFLRALMHFNLARNFEELYYMENSVSWNEALDLTRVAPETVYPKMIADLKVAIPNLPYQDETDHGRVTKGAAQMLLADIYLTTGDKASAKSILGELINDENNPYSLVADFAEIFTDETNSEIIFQIGYVEGSEDLGQEFSQEFTANGFATGVNIPSIDLIDTFGGSWDEESSQVTYEGTDSRFAATIGVYSSKRIFAKYAEDVEYSGKDWIVYRYADALLMYVEAGGEIEYFNEVVQRADATVSPVSSVTDAELLAERRLEFAGENKYIFDVRRLDPTNGLPKLVVPSREDRVR